MIKNLSNGFENIRGENISLVDERMEIAAKIANYKIEHNYVVADQSRELDIFNKIDNNPNEIIKMYYKNVQKSLIEQSKAYQKDLINTLKK